MTTDTGSTLARDANTMIGNLAVPPEVSFIIAAHNVAPFLEEAIGSALQQPGVLVEVIVVDDGSTDGTAGIIERIAKADPRVRWACRAKSGGPARARNEAIALAQGKWLAILDGDDFIEPGRSRHLLDLAAATRADVVADNFERVDMDGRPIGSSMLPAGDSPFAFRVNLATFIDANVTFDKRRLCLGAIKPMIRREFLSSNVITYRDSLPLGEDYFLLLDCLKDGANFLVTSGSGYKYRVRPGSQSWRLTEAHVEQLLQAHRDVRIEVRFAEDTAVLAAARRYVRALRSATLFLEIVNATKKHDVIAAMLKTLSRPATWPLVARFGAEALGKRMRFA